MADIAKVRNLIAIVRAIGIHLTDEEISEIGEVLTKALDRIEKEQS